MILYPSMGITDYPYSGYEYKDKYAHWMTFDGIIEWYHQVSRNLRNIFNWSPIEIDKIDIGRLIRIHREALEDNKKDNNTEDNG